MNSGNDYQLNIIFIVENNIFEYCLNTHNDNMWKFIQNDSFSVRAIETEPS